MAVTAETALRHHERQYEAVLAELCKGPMVTRDYLDRFPRLHATIGSLRNVHLWNITGTGTRDDPYVLHGQRTDVVRVTEAMRDAYYETEHWANFRKRRLAFDNYRCCQCRVRRGEAELHVHHWEYDFFNESLDDVQTYCADCHKRLHSRRIVQKSAFPKKVAQDVARRLGWRPPNGKLF